MPQSHGVDGGSAPLLELYLQYDFLPVRQYAAILEGISEVAETLRITALPYPIDLPYAFREPWSLKMFPVLASVVPPLSIVSAATGESIKVGFDVPRTLFPTLHYNKGDIEVLLPRWTAWVMLTGAALTWGLDRYNDFLDAQKGRLEIQQLRRELGSAPLLPPPMHDRVGLYVHQFRYHASQPNISAATINGIPVPPATNTTR